MKEYFKETDAEILSREELLCLQGTLEIPMTNDYLFRALLQENNRVLKALVCALLHLKPESVRIVSVENPIELGKSYGEKDLFLDVKALLDGNIIINLEMQVVNEHNWEERSLYYLCSSFVHLNKGMDYLEAKSAVQIGFLNFSLFPEAPEFYANFYLLNEKTYQKYSDKLRMAVVDLTQIQLATEEDKAYKIDQWAQFFKSKDWSELAMLAKENDDILSAVGTVYQLSREQQIRQLCEARMDYYKREGDRRRRDAMAAEKDRMLDQKEQRLEQKDKQLEQKEQQVEQKEQQVEQKERQVERKEQQLVERERKLREKELEVEKMLREING